MALQLVAVAIPGQIIVSRDTTFTCTITFSDPVDGKKQPITITCSDPNPNYLIVDRNGAGQSTGFPIIRFMHNEERHLMFCIAIDQSKPPAVPTTLKLTASIAGGPPVESGVMAVNR